MYYMGFNSKWDEQVGMCSSEGDRGAGGQGTGIKFIFSDRKEVILR
jgi:hypothetical protein